MRCVAPRNQAAKQLEELLRARRSVRKYAAAPIALEHVSQLLWVAQGNVGETGLRTVPSAGALYPLSVYAVAGDVDGLAPGVYGYAPRSHALRRVCDRDLRDALSEAALGQEWVRTAAVDLLIVADYTHTTDRYHDRGLRYVYMEAGHASQNVYLLATALGLATVAVGAFDDDRVAHALNLPYTEHPLYIMPVGVALAP
ncbi:MAG: SagB/ThcOx family dehydrogenase [Candidatus Hydrogenedentes bacterium]|nr:SagB/ThcOx family dehydrogenase [Candidatus Hydrogenedentota bacterium]